MTTKKIQSLTSCLLQVLSQSLTGFQMVSLPTALGMASQQGWSKDLKAKKAD